MSFILIGWIIFCVFLLFYIFCLKKQMRNITDQLNEYNRGDSRKKIDVQLVDKDMINLASSINKYIDINIQSQINQKKLEVEIRKAISNVSHDLRTPLTSILGYIQMIKKGNLAQKKQMEYINIAENRAKDLQNLLNDFFSFQLYNPLTIKLSLKWLI